MNDIKLPKFLSSTWDWLFPSQTYESAKKRATLDVVSRYGRGNVSVQNGYILDKSQMKIQSKEADKALARMNKRAPARNSR